MSVGHPLPEEVRLAIVRAFEEHGLKYAEIATLLDVGEASVSRMLRLHRETGGVAAKPKGGGRLSPIRGKIAEKLKALVRASPDSTIPELMDRLVAETGVVTSLPAMKRAMHRLGFSRKKRSS